MPLPYPYDIICFLFGAIGLFFYLMYLRRNYLRREKYDLKSNGSVCGWGSNFTLKAESTVSRSSPVLIVSGSSGGLRPQSLEYFATGLNINRVKLLIDGKEPFELKGVLVRNIEDNMFSIQMTGDLKDGHQAY